AEAHAAAAQRDGGDAARDRDVRVGGAAARRRFEAEVRDRGTGALDQRVAERDLARRPVADQLELDGQRVAVRAQAVLLCDGLTDRGLEDRVDAAQPLIA